MKNCTQHAELEHAFRANRKLITNWLEGRLGDRSTAEDVAQSVFLTVWSRSHSCRIENPKALLFKVARDLANNEYSRRTRCALRLASSSSEESNIIDRNRQNNETPEKVVAGKQELALLLQQIDELPPKLRIAFKLSRFNGLNYGQISERMNVSVSSVEKYIIQALQILKRVRYGTSK